MDSSSSAHNNGRDNNYDPAATIAAYILLSMSYSSSPSPSSSSSTFSPPPNIPPVRWSNKKKRSTIVDRGRDQVVPNNLESHMNLLIKDQVVITPKAELDLEDEVMSKLEHLQFVRGKTLERALEDLKRDYESNNAIIPAIQAFEFLLSEDLNRDEMLDVLDGISGVRKRKNNVKSENSKKNKKKKPKIEESAKLMNLAELAGDYDDDDDLRGSTIIMRTYECKECKEVFSSSQALGGHTASHNRKKRIEEEVVLQTRSDLTETVTGDSGLVADQKNNVYQCNLCTMSFPTGQALGGHKTYHRKITDGIHAQKKASSSTLHAMNKNPFEFDLNVVAIDDQNSESLNVVREVVFIRN